MKKCRNALSMERNKTHLNKFGKETLLSYETLGKAKMLNKVLPCQKKEKKLKSGTVYPNDNDNDGFPYFVDFMAQAEEELTCISARK